MDDKEKILVVGAGSWGTAIAYLLNRNNKSVCLWSYDKDLINKLKATNYNNDYLNNVNLEGISFSSDVDTFDEFDTLVNVVPTKFITENYKKINKDLSRKKIINCSKGIEISTNRRISNIFKNEFGVKSENYCNLSGPSHAEEVVNNSLTTILSASVNLELANYTQNIFSNNFFRVYTSNDVIGSEIGGALKNVIAIAAGILDGLEMGDNSKAALITRGLAEISRYGVYFGANPLTFSGLSGLGDLIVTCTSHHSRNRRLGELIGRGFDVKQILTDNKMISEGYFTAKAIYKNIIEEKIEMPISEEIYLILYENKDPKESMKDLMKRTYKNEIY